MKSVFVHQDTAQAGLVQSLLESEGIASFVRNQLTHTLVGISIIGPLRIFDPEVCIVNDDDHPRAMELLRRFQSPAAEGHDLHEWICPQCRERVPGTFEECWSCQAAKV